MHPALVSVDVMVMAATVPDVKAAPDSILGFEIRIPARLDRIICADLPRPFGWAGKDIGPTRSTDGSDLLQKPLKETFRDAFISAESGVRREV